MKRLASIISFLVLLATVNPSHAQSRKAFSPESIYRPVYGYVIDTLTSQPMQKVMVYGFDSIDDANVGRDALLQSRSPLKARTKGDVVETMTDASGRYMLPVLSSGALLFYFADTKKIVVKEVCGRNSVSIGKKDEKPAFSIDLSAYSVAPVRSGNVKPSGVKMGLDFNYHFPYRGEDRKNCRIVVERIMTDVETGEVLTRHVPVVRDGKGYRRMKKKAMAKGLAPSDTLLDLARKFKPLVDSTSVVRIKDSIDTELWKDRCFSLDYAISLDNAGTVSGLDTLHIMTNRVDRPLKYLDCRFDPYEWVPEEPVENKRKPVRRKLTLEGEYDGEVPEMLKDSAYTLAGLYIKAVVAPKTTYAEDMAAADARVEEVMGDLRGIFGERINKDVRVIRTSEVVVLSKLADAIEDDMPEVAEKMRKVVRKYPDDPDAQIIELSSMPEYEEFALPMLKDMERVEYRYEFHTLRRFSRSQYLGLLSYADDDDERERICLQALEESSVLEGSTWDYAANTLASVYIRKGCADTLLLAPFAAMEPDEDVHDEMSANHVVMLMMAGENGRASSLAKTLPQQYACLKEVSECLAGGEPSGKDGIAQIRATSVRNDVLMDMYEMNVGDATLARIDGMDDGDAMKWYLKARAICLVCGDDILGEKQNVKACLEKAFAMDESLKKTAALDAGINEHVLKEVLGVFVL